MKSTINRTQIGQKVSKLSGEGSAKVLKIIELCEQEIINGAMERGQVRLGGFGTFYKIIRKSHKITQINTKTPRLLLDQPALKFRPTPGFKDVIFDRPSRVRQRTSLPVTSKLVTSKPATSKPEAILPLTKPASRFKFAPLKINSRVNSEEVRKKIQEKIKAIGARKRDEVVHTIRKPLNQSPAGKVFGNLIKQLERQGHSKLNFFYHDTGKKVDVYLLKPKKRLGSLPKEIVERFMDEYLEINHLHLPQERFVILAIDSKINDRIYLSVHSLPIIEGASVVMSFKIK